MSMLLMVEAMKAKVGNPLRKLVLIKLADQANDKGECWPSYQSIADACEISRRCVIQHVAWLEENGFLRRVKRQDDSGFQRSNVFVLTLKKGGANAAPGGANAAPGGANAAPGGANAAPGGANAAPGGSANAAPIKEPVILEPVNESVSETVGSARARARDGCAAATPPPQNPPDMPSVGLSGKKLAARMAFTAFLVQRGIDQSVALDWWAYRNGKPMTETAWKRHCLEAERAGISPAKAAWFAAGEGWQGFHADGYLRRKSHGFGEKHAIIQGNNRKLTPLEQFYEAEREWAERADAAMHGECGGWQDGQFREV